MKEALIIEIIAIAVGIVVIVIETYIIFLLKKHLKVLDNHLTHNDSLLKKFREGIETHLNHLNEHSHNMEKSLDKICAPENKQTKKRNT